MADEVTLVPMTVDDTSDVLKWRNAEFVKEWFCYRETITEQDHMNWIENKVKTGKVFQFIICVGTHRIGSIYLNDVDYKNRKAELGIFIGEKEYLGKGYGKAAVKQLIRYGFDKINLNKIFLRVLEGNIRAIKSYETVGFKLDGIARQDIIINGQKINVHFMSILKEDDLIG